MLVTSVTFVTLMYPDPQTSVSSVNIFTACMMSRLEEEEEEEDAAGPSN